MNVNDKIKQVLKAHPDLSIYSGVVVREIPSELLPVDHEGWEVLFTLKGQPAPVTSFATETITQAAAETIAAELRKLMPNRVRRVRVTFTRQALKEYMGVTFVDIPEGVAEEEVEDYVNNEAETHLMQGLVYFTASDEEPVFNEAAVISDTTSEGVL